MKDIVMGKLIVNSWEVTNQYIAFLKKKNGENYSVKKLCWEATCTRCGNKVLRHADTIKRHSCFCIHRKNTGEMTGTKWCEIRKSARRRKLEFTITKEYVWELFIKQNRLCAISGIKLQLPRNYAEKYSCNASLDRIDSSKGYIKGNVQWVHKDINFIKQTYTQEYLIELCTTIANYNKKDKGDRQKKKVC